jgi:hypothetical protein
VTSAKQTRHDLSHNDPASVWQLSENHSAVVEARTLFPLTVVDPDDSPRLLVSGFNNSKIGKTVTKGDWKGMPIYTLTLEERATCPSSCFMFRTCYGNAMQFARRHRAGTTLERRLEKEIADMARAHPGGFVVRLHVLGDFYSVAYAKLWHLLLSKHTALNVYGYTSRSISATSEVDRAIAEEISAMNSDFRSRCFIRTSAPTPQAFGATVIDRAPEAKVVPEGLVCPAQMSAQENCASCALCWSPSARDKTIVFVKHGNTTNREGATGPVTKLDSNRMRPVRRMDLGKASVGEIADQAPQFIEVPPSDLWIDESYQRGLSRKSARLIISVATNWQWSKFKPPVVTRETDGRLFVIDGQHTAIAAASRGDIDLLPCMLVNAETRASRAQSFIGHNRDRISVTPLQLHRAQVIAGDAVAVAIDLACKEAGVTILSAPPPNGNYAHGQTLALSTIHKLVTQRGAKMARNVLMVCAGAKRVPITSDEIKAVDHLIHGHSPVDAGDLMLLLRVRGAEIIRETTIYRLGDASVKRWELIASALRRHMAERRA